MLKNVNPLDPTRPRRFWGRVTFWLARLPIRLKLRQPITCPRCKTDITIHPLYRQWRVCGSCGHHFSIPARERIKRLVDPRSFHEFPLALYTSATREAVVTGTARIAKQQLVIAAFDFSVHGGTMSIAVGEQITRAVEYATQQHMPLVVITTTGGVRIQEGMPALLQMVKTTQAVKEFQNHGHPFIAVLCNPTTGGVYASFANLADIIFAEPGALIGFAGPRVAEALLHQKLPADSHRAETAYASGMIDAIVPRADLRNRLAQILSKTAAPENNGPGTMIESERQPQSATAAEIVALARHPERPTALDYIQRLFSDFVELHGDRLHGDDPAIIGGLARLQNQAMLIIAQTRTSAGPSGYRKAERLIHLAARLRLPIVTFIDTPGADPGYESERHGIANSIANCLAALAQSPMPTVSMIIGEGTSGGALALAATDRVLMMENATYAVISPEGASAILFGDASHASKTVETLGNRADDLLPLGIIDEIVREPEGGAQRRPDAAIETVNLALSRNLVHLQSQDDTERLAARRARYRNAGLNTP
jgi:acetyl-CoA carboxylase carboxyl transferase subunit beta